MNNDFVNFLDDIGIENSFENEGINSLRMVKYFPCVYCSGTGKFINFEGDEQGDCYSCKGAGEMKMDADAQRERREKNKARAIKSRETLAANQRANRVANQSHNEGKLHRWCAENDHWNEFCASLMEQNLAGRAWSEKQVAALERMREKTEATRAAKRKTIEDNAESIDLASIKAMFDAAVASGYKRPKYRAEDLVLSRAPDTGRNPGALYVKSDSLDAGQGEYFGKILDGKYYGNQQAVEPLKAIAADPSGAAMRWGQKTGRCSCCGKTLTAPESIALGIGPICANRWGF